MHAMKNTNLSQSCYFMPIVKLWALLFTSRFGLLSLTFARTSHSRLLFLHRPSSSRRYSYFELRAPKHDFFTYLFVKVAVLYRLSRSRRDILYVLPRAVRPHPCPRSQERRSVRQPPVVWRCLNLNLRCLNLQVKYSRFSYISLSRNMYFPKSSS